MFGKLMSAGGSAVSAYGSYNAGKAAMKNARYNARMSMLQSETLKAKTTFDQVTQVRKGEKVMGALRAKLGASGAMMSEGAGLELQTEQAWELAQENMLIGVEGRRDAAAAEAQAHVALTQGRNARSAARGQAFATLLSGGGQMADSGMFGSIKSAFSGGGASSSILSGAGF